MWVNSWSISESNNIVEKEFAYPRVKFLYNLLAVWTWEIIFIWQMFWFFFCKADKIMFILKGCWKIRVNAIYEGFSQHTLPKVGKLKFSLFPSCSFLSLPFFQSKCLYVNNKCMDPMRVQGEIFILILLFLVSSN